MGIFFYPIDNQEERFLVVKFHHYLTKKLRFFSDFLKVVHNNTEPKYYEYLIYFQSKQN
jgi:hypothetical protein